MTIKFKVIFENKGVSLVEYVFKNFKSYNFDMKHYHVDGGLLADNVAYNYPVKKAMSNLIRRAKQNNAIVKIVDRKSNDTKYE